MIMVKSGVVFKALHKEIYNVFPVIEHAFAPYGVQGVYAVITSANDGQHMTTSKHYADLAIDLRSKHLRPEDKPKVLAALESALGPDYDIILECPGQPNEHFHCEYDPKAGKRPK